jgi:hypothetical protein
LPTQNCACRARDNCTADGASGTGPDVAAGEFFVAVTGPVFGSTGIATDNAFDGGGVRGGAGGLGITPPCGHRGW